MTPDLIYMHSATVAPGPEACLQPLSCSTARTLKMKIRAFDGSRPCIIQPQHSLHVPQVPTTRTSLLLMQIKALIVWLQTAHRSIKKAENTEIY